MHWDIIISSATKCFTAILPGNGRLCERVYRVTDCEYRQIGVFGVMNVKQYSLTISTGECCVTIINELTISHSDYYMG